MSDPTPEDVATARELVTTYANPSQYDDNLEDRIARAIASARKAPPGHIIDDQGVVRKVLGTLPLTADGCVICDIWDCSLFNENGEKLDTIGNGMAWGPVIFCVDTGERYRRSYPFRKCYSTRASAEAARKEPHAT